MIRRPNRPLVRRTGLLQFLGVAFAMAAGAALAQSSAPPRLDPLPAPPPMPAGTTDEPRVRIPVQEGDKVEEIREGGRIVMLKVTPPSGNPYYLVDIAGNGIWSRRDSLDPGTRVPMWPIKTFD